MIQERRKGEAAEREAAYEHALGKAEAASRALKDEAMGVQIEEEKDEEDEEVDELAQSLERARQAALKAAPKGKLLPSHPSCVRESGQGFTVENLENNSGAQRVSSAESSQFRFCNQGVKD